MLGICSAGSMVALVSSYVLIIYKHSEFIYLHF